MQPLQSYFKIMRQDINKMSTLSTNNFAIGRCSRVYGGHHSGEGPASLELALVLALGERCGR